MTPPDDPVCSSNSGAAGIVISFDIRAACNVENTLGRSTSSSDDRGFTCQLVFIIPLRFVVYSTGINLSYVKYFPIAVFFTEAQRRTQGLYFVLLFLKLNQPQMVFGTVV